MAEKDICGIWNMVRTPPGTTPMTPNRLTPLLLALIAISAPGSASAQVVRIDLVERGQPVPLQLTSDEVTLGRTLTHGLLASARRDVTRPITDADLTALGERGTLLSVRLASPEDVLLLRLRARARPTRLAAYVPPDRDDYAYVFLGRTGWDRIVIVDLPDVARTALRRLRAGEAAAAGR